MYGVNNLRLHQIEQSFPELSFVARGSELKAQGETERIDQLKQLMAALLEEVKRKGHVPEHRFTELLARPGGPPPQPSFDPVSPDTVLVHGSSGLLVRPKNQGQQLIVGAAQNHDIVFATGPAGTGKTYIAVALAVRALKEKRVKKIVLCRPAVDAGESLGFLPGDLKEKVDPYLRPLYDALEDMLHTEKLKYYLETNVVEIVPLAYMRGRTLNHAFVIMDEAQNATEAQMKMFLTRMGEHSRVVVTGDETQIDLPPKQRSGLVHAKRILQDIPGIAFVHLKTTDVVRHRLVREIITAYEKAEASREESFGRESREKGR